MILIDNVDSDDYNVIVMMVFDYDDNDDDICMCS